MTKIYSKVAEITKNSRSIKKQRTLPLRYRPLNKLFFATFNGIKNNYEFCTAEADKVLPSRAAVARASLVCNACPRLTALSALVTKTLMPL